MKYRLFVGISSDNIGWNGRSGNKKASNHNDHWLSLCIFGCLVGAEDWSRTSTGVSPPAPQADVSTNSTTSAAVGHIKFVPWPVKKSSHSPGQWIRQFVALPYALAWSGYSPMNQW